MDIEEFKNQIDKVISKYGFVYSKEIKPYTKSTWHNWINGLNQKEKPDSYFQICVSEDESNVLLYYNSVLYHYSPTGQHSITSKTYIKEVKKDVKKFKWNVFEKWCNSQQETVNMILRLYKEKAVENKMKEIKKDF